MQEKKSEKVHAELNRLAAKLVFPNEVREASERLAATLVAKKLVDRVPPSVIAASSVYAVSRDSRTPLTLRELATSSGSSPKEIGRCYRSIVDSMGLTPPSIDASLYAFKVAEMAHVSDEAANLSSVIVRRAVEAGLGGRNPMTLAAAAVYTACLNTGENKTQSSVAEAAGVTEVSVRESAKAMRRLVTLSTRAPQ